MRFIKTEIDWVFEVIFDNFEDDRWSFVKTFHYDEFKKIWLQDNFKESFYSVSKKNVIRWLHFQLPPYHHDKFVFPINWEIKDVIVDLRKWSKTYWKHISLILSKEKNNWVFIPKWFAHWFLCLSKNTTLMYMDTTIFNKEHDSGIRWDSIWFDWWITNPIISEKDKKLVNLNDFDSPFKY